jgi:hypothetical protein
MIGLGMKEVEMDIRRSSELPSILLEFDAAAKLIEGCSGHPRGRWRIRQ